MTGILTLEKIIAFLKVDLVFACCWPLQVKATKFQKICNKIFRLFCCLNGILMSVSLFYTLSNKCYNMLLVMKVGCELSAFLQIPIQITLFTFQSDRLQIIICEMEDYINRAKSEERSIFNQYIKKCKLFYITTICWLTITASAMIFGPILLSQPFPIEVDYPFDVNKQPLRTIIYLHHAMAVYQSYVQVSSNIFVALLLWFVAARFDILSQKFQKISSISEFMMCVQLHQQLLRYAKNVTMTIRYIALSSIGFSTVAVVFSGLTFLSRQPFAIKIQFFTVGASALIEVFVCAWPAEYLLRTSFNVAQAAYESLWYNQDVIFQKKLCFILLKSQVPVALSVYSILPTISLQYYASYVSTAFSYLTTFRIILSDET
ncbi:odorant receptor 4-like [Pogonomyrmex barbatus]|uniref:Odorant receptor n=1 Tax=Pogonomyrmex barbatus TaxID=144034 RepID=A0A8N1S8R9_9HYME|nr:odorant receptor 4-like [Pogonomyrmex barbatus]